MLKQPDNQEQACALQGLRLRQKVCGISQVSVLIEPRRSSGKSSLKPGRDFHAMIIARRPQKRDTFAAL
jgi:hypothetical protein